MDSVASCLDSDGELDPSLYFRMIEDEESNSKKRRKKHNHASLLACKRLHKRIISSSSRKRKRNRSVQKNKIQYIDEDGKIFTLTPKKTVWYCWYVANGKHLKPGELAKFRRRFRLPYDQYVELLNELETSDHFKRWRKGNTDRCGKEASPLSLLLLGALRYLGRGWTFDDIIEEATAISEETHRQFFHTFIHYGSTVLFDKYVLTPASKDDAGIHIHEFDLAGFPGCVSSTDATHIAMDCCAHKLCHIHKGFKLNLPSRTYNLSCNHRRRILFTTSGHPASWNDKTLQRFDKFMTGIYSGKLLNDVTFELYDNNKEGKSSRFNTKALGK